MTLKNLMVLGLFAGSLAAAGCAAKTEASKTVAKVEKSEKKGDGHDHGETPHGGTILELGKDHGEFCVDHGKKQVTVYLLGEDAKTASPIKVEKLLLSIKTPQFQVDLKAEPQASDPKGTSSRFVATHENFAKEQEFEGTVSVEIDGKPYLGDFKEKEHKDHKNDGKKDGDKKKAMADGHGTIVAQADPKEAEVYLKPGGIYTEADIKANGNTTVSVKYKTLKVAHDLKPKPGDKICPITLTKANAALTWVIGGKTYEFCCQPCVEEFVTLAKEKPSEIKEPGAYVKQ